MFIYMWMCPTGGTIIKRGHVYRATSVVRNIAPLGPYSRKSPDSGS